MNTNPDLPTELGAFAELPRASLFSSRTALEPMPNLTVNVSGGNSDVTDASGYYDISHGGTSNVTVTAQLLGPYSNINRYTGLGSDASFSDTATPGTPFTITWDGW